MLLVSLVFAACGDDGGDESVTPAATGAAGSGSGSAPSTAGGEEVQVDMVDIKFDPADVTVKAGQKIVWTNKDDVQHDADATSGADFNTELVGKGGTVEWVAEGSGKIDYVCSVHPSMTGTITVE